MKIESGELLIPKLSQRKLTPHVKSFFESRVLRKIPDTNPVKWEVTYETENGGAALAKLASDPDITVIDMQITPNILHSSDVNIKTINTLYVMTFIEK